MMLVIVAAITLSILLAGQTWAAWRTCKFTLRRASLQLSQLDHLLTLMQLVQKHRGLGAQRSSAGALQREQVSREIERQWEFWATQAADTRAVYAQWQALKENPSDYSGHCELIDRFLNAIALLERRLDAAGAQPAEGSGESGESGEAIGARCRAIEDLGRLRGLSSHATRHLHCPIELEVPLRYLCQRLAQTRFRRDELAVRNAVKEIVEGLLDSPQVAISAARCFELLTPVIDGELEDVRRTLQWTQPAVAGKGRSAIALPRDRERMGAGMLSAGG